MRLFKRQPQTPNWGIAITRLGNSRYETRTERGMEEKLEALRKKWGSARPDEEWSVMLEKGELVYMGRFAEGVVLRLNDKEDHITFLTPEMAAELGRKLMVKGGDQAPEMKL